MVPSRKNLSRKQAKDDELVIEIDGETRKGKKRKHAIPPLPANQVASLEGLVLNQRQRLTQLIDRIADQCKGFSKWQIEGTVKLFEQGCTVPFVARYRKEVTGGLDEIQLRDVEENFDD